MLNVQIAKESASDENIFSLPVYVVVNVILGLFLFAQLICNARNASRLKHD